MHPSFLLVAKKHCLIDRCLPQKTPNTTVSVDTFQTQAFCTASCFLLPYTTLWFSLWFFLLLFFFTALTPVSYKLALRRAKREIQLTGMHLSSSIDEYSLNSSRANLNKRWETTLHQKNSKAKCSLLRKQPTHSLCLAAFSLKWTGRKFPTQDLKFSTKLLILAIVWMNTDLLQPSLPSFKTCLIPKEPKTTHGDSSIWPFHP